MAVHLLTLYSQGGFTALLPGIILGLARVLAPVADCHCCY